MTSRIALLPVLFAFSAALPAAAQAPRLFDAPRFLNEAQGGSVRELGDFDGDLDLDLVHVLGQSQSEWSGFRLLANDGDSRFTAGPSITFPAPGGSFATEFCARDEPHAGDFDGDGNLDLAFDHYKNVFTTDSVGGLEVYFGDGAGGFAAPINTGVATASSFVVGQADLDPAQEIAMWGQDVTGARFAWWLDWNGTAFQASPGLPLAHSGDTGGGLVEAEALDLDGDGIDDLVGRSQTYLNLRVLATVGGQFTYGQVVALPGGFATINSTLVGGDLDADGDPEMAVIQRQFGPTYDPIFLVHRNDAGFLVQQTPQTVSLPTSVYTGYTWQVRDWNEDGFNDALDYSSEIAQVAGDGALGLQFAGAVRIASQNCEAGAGDLDGDGHLDVAAAELVYLGDGTFKNVPPGPADLDITLADTCAFAEDREGDGDLDVLAPSGGSAGFYKANDAAGGFSNGSATLPVLPPSHFLSTARTFADFSFDGRRDWLMGMHKQVSLFVTEFVEMVWLIDDGVGGYTLAGGVTPPGVQIPIPSTPLKHFPVGDIDGDGDQDLLTSNGHWENSGIGFGGAKIASFTGDAVDALDFDGDGDLDILVSHLEGGSGYTTRLLRQAGGTFTPQVLKAWSNRPLAFFRDLEGDGDQDIVAGMVDGPITAVFENVGGAAVDRGTLAMQLQRELTVAVHDVDGDGLKDLLGVGTGSTGMNPPDDVGPAWFRRVGPGLIYATPEIYKNFFGVIGLFDSDGDADIDSVGMYTLDGQEHVEPSSGVIRQFGTATPGSGGIRPILGASGPMWTGSTTAVERVRRGLGGAPMILIYGFNEVAIADFPLVGLTLYTNPFVIFGTFLLSGPPGVPGVGAFDFALPTGPELAGLRLYKQAFVIDLAAPTGLACQTNGLELVWGS